MREDGAVWITDWKNEEDGAVWVMDWILIQLQVREVDTSV